MGRWGPGLFACDRDLDLADALVVEISGVEDGPENDVLSCFGGGSTIYDREGKAVDGSSILEGLREKLDAGLGDSLIDKYRNLVTATKDGWAKHESKYKSVLLAAVIMGTGAKIRDHDLQYLRQLGSEVESNERQFLVALDNYEPDTCGKTHQDTGKDLVKCGGCWSAWFCDKGCERRAWSVHRNDCDGSGTRGL
ncbi:hypothetical protein C8A01DRAFT_36049 [Parachaetomium inaequale]|uniref:MYND-type domain-containing protein n=1 Tax=Parachaetomium inaequale TaxID=2588326 RepID=A0AAN6PFT8_9PEZI|nr:hypothetical protein C8A01DRAFT_36049 [Parachaetomium inaequale]